MWREDRVLPEVIGSYKIERELGRGGFGVVYEGVDLKLGRRAAIKQLLPELTTSRAFVERFFNEAKAAASINHRGIVDIYEVGWDGSGTAYFAMKLLQGESLTARLRGRRLLPVAQATSIARQVASALAAAHARNIIHRDLKPDNILIVPDEEVSSGEQATVLDFGIAKLLGEDPATLKTQTGALMGTPRYMSPEQCRGSGDITDRADVYSLGCILYEMLGGRPPFVGEGTGQIVGMHQFVEPVDIAELRPDLPKPLAALVMRLLAKDPTTRPRMIELTALLGTETKPPADISRDNTQPSFDSQPLPAVEPASTTTLRNAGGERASATPPPKPDRRFVLGLAALGALGIAALVFALTRSPSGDPQLAATPDAPPSLITISVMHSIGKQPVTFVIGDQRIAPRSVVASPEPVEIAIIVQGTEAFMGNARREGAFHEVVDAIERLHQDALPNSRGMLVVFGSRAKVLYDGELTGLTGTKLGALEDYKGEHVADLGVGLDEALSKLRRRTPLGKRYLIVISNSTALHKGIDVARLNQRFEREAIEVHHLAINDGEPAGALDTHTRILLTHDALGPAATAVEDRMSEDTIVEVAVPHIQQTTRATLEIGRISYPLDLAPNKVQYMID